MKEPRLPRLPNICLKKSTNEVEKDIRISMQLQQAKIIFSRAIDHLQLLAASAAELLLAVKEVTPTKLDYIYMKYHRRQNQRALSQAFPFSDLIAVEACSSSCRSVALTFTLRRNVNCIFAAQYRFHMLDDIRSMIFR